MVALTDEGVLFAKNSDRDPNEAQVIEWHPAADHAPGSSLQATWISIPQVAHTHAIAISRPWWMWGAEMGANEHGVVIGNEAVFTRASTKGDPGLLGMDLLRLALERATDAATAVQTIVALLETYGQAGSCSHDHPSFTYHNSFLVADADGAIVLETAGREWAVERVVGRSRAISNGLTIAGFAERHTDRLRTAVAGAHPRRDWSQRCGADEPTVFGLLAALRAESPRWSPISGKMTRPNMRAGGLLASSQTAGSWIADLRGASNVADTGSTAAHWVTGASDPSLSLYMPLRIDEPVDLGPAPTGSFDPGSYWWRHERLHRLAAGDPDAARALVAPQFDELQRAWFDAPPTGAAAWAAASAFTDRWLGVLEDAAAAGSFTDRRPWWVRQRWAAFDRAAGMPRGTTAASRPAGPAGRSAA